MLTGDPGGDIAKKAQLLRDDGFSEKDIGEFVKSEKKALLESGRSTKPGEFVVDPQNWTAWEIFARASRPRRDSNGNLSLLDMPVALSLIEWETDSLPEKKELFDSIRTIENSAAVVVGK